MDRSRRDRIAARDHQDARTQLDPVVHATYGLPARELPNPKLALRPQRQFEVEWFEQRIIAPDVRLRRAADQPLPRR